MIAIKSLQSLSFAVLLTSTAIAQQTNNPQDNVPRATVSMAKFAPDGRLVLSVKIYASKSDPLILHGPLVESSSSEEPVYHPFSLNGSTLTDVSTNKVYKNSPTLPTEPFMGRMERYVSLEPGGWARMGLAFPPIPAPPEVDGKKQPYQLVLEIPQLKIRTPVKLDPETLKPI